MQKYGSPEPLTPVDDDTLTEPQGIDVTALRSEASSTSPFRAQDVIDEGTDREAQD